MSERTTSLDPPKLFRDVPIKEVVVAETTTINIYWDRAWEFCFNKYTEEDRFLSHSLVVAREEDGEAVALLESWAPRSVFTPQRLAGDPGDSLANFLGDRAGGSWIFQAVRVSSLHESDAAVLGVGPGEAAVCLWRYCHDDDSDLVLAQRFVLTNGYAGYFRIPLVWREWEYQAREETFGSSEA